MSRSSPFVALACLALVAGLGDASGGKKKRGTPKSTTIASGTYSGSATSTARFELSDGDICTSDANAALTFVIQGDGTAQWSGMYRVDGECTQSTYQGGACWTYADATFGPVTKGKALLTSVPTGRATVPPMPGDRIVWKCGKSRVVLPEEDGKPASGCVKLGRYEDPNDVQAAELRCGFTDSDFPELAKTKVTVGKKGLTLKITGEMGKKMTLTLKRTGDAAPRTETSPPAEANPPAPAIGPFMCSGSHCRRTSDECEEERVQMRKTSQWEPPDCQERDVAYCFTITGSGDVKEVCTMKPLDDGVPPDKYCNEERQWHVNSDVTLSKCQEVRYER